MEWYYSQDGAQKGPVDAGELLGMLNSGALAPSELVWKQGMESWLPATEVAEFASELSLQQASSIAQGDSAQQTAQAPAQAGEPQPNTQSGEANLIEGATPGKMIKKPTPVDDTAQGGSLGPPKGQLPKEGGNPYHPGVSTMGHSAAGAMGAAGNSWEPLIRARKWMSFVGVLTIIGGVLYVWTIIGILYIFMGVWLMQAAGALKQMETTPAQTTAQQASSALSKFFIATGILFLISLILTVLVIAFYLFVFLFAGGLAAFGSLEGLEGLEGL